jgi:hypothetical protein
MHRLLKSFHIQRVSAYMFAIFRDDIPEDGKHIYLSTVFSSRF